MADIRDMIDFDKDPNENKLPWGKIIGVVVVIGILIAIIYAVREQRAEAAREAITAAMDKDLVADEATLKAEREKLTDLSRRAETLRSMIQAKQVKNGKAAVAEYQQLAAEQHAERDKYTQMAEDYNKKVAKFKEVSEQ